MVCVPGRVQPPLPRHKKPLISTDISSALWGGACPALRAGSIQRTDLVTTTTAATSSNIDQCEPTPSRPLMPLCEVVDVRPEEVTLVAPELPQAAASSTDIPLISRPLPLLLEKVRVHLEKNSGGDTRGQFYDRISVTCNEHCAKPCRKRRNCHTGQCSSHGRLEPYAYLGAWLEAKTLFKTQEEHCKHCPDEDAVGRYMQKMGWA